MANYCITFRIADETVNGKTYDQRREQLIENVYTKGSGFWDDTTSFILVESNVDTMTLAKRAKTALSAADDMLLIFNQSDLSAAYFGVVGHVNVLKSFFPLLQKVT